MKKNTLYLLIVGFFFFSQLLIAQIHVDNNGSVGVGTGTPNSLSKLHITSDGLTTGTLELLKVNYTGALSLIHHKGLYSICEPRYGYGYGGHLKGGYAGLISEAILSGNGDRFGVKAYAKNSYYRTFGLYAYAYGDDAQNNYGVYGHASCSPNAYDENIGVYGIANGPSDYRNVGVYAYAYGAEDENFGIYASCPTSDGDAGYFYGNVKITGSLKVGSTYYYSDEKLKDDIGDISDALSQVKKLSAKTYKFKKNTGLNLSDEKQYGFTAQELETIFPELVTDVVQSVHKDPELVNPDSEVLENEGVNNKQKKNEKISYKAINYTELIPILTQAIQEQQEMIEDLQKRVEQLEKK